MPEASSRRSSLSSDDQEFHDGRSRSPTLAGLDSTSALILLPDEQDSGSPFDFSDEDDDGDEPLEATTRTASSIPSLSPSTVFLYLLSPYLSLGALLLPSTFTPLKYGLGAMVLFAALSVFVRQIWYMLARYMRTTSMEDVIVDAFARGRGKEKPRRVLKGLIRFSTGSLRALLAAMYLQDAANTLSPFLPQTLLVPSLSTRPILPAILALAIFPLSLPTSIAAKRVIYATWASTGSYMLWLGCVSYAHGKGSLGVSPVWHGINGLWNGITVMALTFTSSYTLPLYIALKGSQPITTKTGRSHSFKMLSLSSVATAVLLILPLIFFSASPNRTETSTELPNPLLAVLSAFTLVLRIPFLLVTAPKISLPTSVRRSTSAVFQDMFGKALVWVSILVLAVVSVLGGPKMGRIICDLGLVAALASTYLLPAILHITLHHFKRPLSIIIPNTPLTTALSPSSPSSQSHPSAPPAHSPYDELLQRKERALQRRRLGRRIIWDVGVWVLLLPVGGSGVVWGVGRIFRRW